MLPIFAIAIVTILALVSVYWLVKRLGFEKKEAVELTCGVINTVLAITLAYATWTQFRAGIDADRRTETRQRTELRNTIWDIWDQFPAGGVPLLSSLDAEQRQKWLKQMHKLLREAEGNQVLLGDTESVGYWRNAVAASKERGDVPLIYTDTDLFLKRAHSILAGVTKTWDRLILESSEPGLTGGVPR